MRRGPAAAVHVALVGVATSSKSAGPSRPRRDDLRPRISPLGNRREALQVVSPALRVRRRLGLWQTAVDDADPSPFALRDKSDLQRAGMRRKRFRATSPPCDHDSPGGIELQVASFNRCVSEEERELSAWAWVDDRSVTHPPDEGLGPGEIVEYDIGLGCDVDRIAVGLNGQGWPPPPA